MAFTGYFTDAQAQFEESQKKFAELWEDSQKQIIESQKQLISSWVDSLPAGATQINLPENAEKALNFQRDVINSMLKAQQTAAHLAVETQKQFWANYFQTMQQVPQVKPIVS